MALLPEGSFDIDTIFKFSSQLLTSLALYPRSFFPDSSYSFSFLGVESVAEAVEKERVVTSKEKERLPRIPPPRKRKNRMNRGRKSEVIVMGMLTAVRKI